MCGGTVSVREGIKMEKTKKFSDLFRQKNYLALALISGIIMFLYTTRCYVTQCREENKVWLWIVTFFMCMLLGFVLSGYVMKRSGDMVAYILVGAAVFSNSLQGNFGIDGSKYSMLMLVSLFFVTVFGLSDFRHGWIAVISYLGMSVMAVLYGFQPLMFSALLLSFYPAFCRQPPKGVSDKNASKAWKEQNETNQFWLIAMVIMFIMAFVYVVLKGHKFIASSFDYDYTFVIFEEIFLALPFSVPMYIVLAKYSKRTENKARKAFAVLMMLLPVFVLAVSFNQNWTGYIGKSKYAINIGQLAALWMLYEDGDSDFVKLVKDFTDYFKKNIWLLVIIAAGIVFYGIMAGMTAV